MSRVIFARFTPEEAEAVERIVARALFDEHGIEHDDLSIRMDLSATHARCPLRLDELAEADEFSFVHGIIGIYRHLNRQTGYLERFLPRYAKPKAL